MKELPSYFKKVPSIEDERPKSPNLVDRAWGRYERERALQEARSFNRNRFYFQFEDNKIGKVGLKIPLKN